ncbi:tRNA ligase 1 [Grifola frondosa]|uniref:tRNA ligase 1 n=1 Tax=Grifola frondosa TaxID=5627 RepID=A0A1C7MMI3_GRIFR|nr:tRNA ligase 1 [Grifola frondosa]
MGIIRGAHRPPYTLTLKSNGCIIFIAALTPSKLLVTSKHSLGHIQNVEESHAEVGERWLRKQLADAGKTEEQLAGALWEKKWTAVAELCDDSFEEHVLRISKEMTGLHLHGLNACTKRFATQHQDVVDAFAEEWGFIGTKSTVLDSIPKVKAFTEEIGKSGSWDGNALEGFVVRTHVTEPPTKGNAPVSASPYPVVTKAILSRGESNIPKSKLRRAETKLYVKWVVGEIKRDRSQFKDYAKGKGIIATRDRFLMWMEEHADEKKAAELSQEQSLHPSNKEFGKTIIVPVAIPGVGKTTIAVALVHLFNFGHTQSDDINAKKAAPAFIKNVVNLLKTHDVVIADKNNHLRQHRQQLRDAVKNFTPPVRLMALNWSFDQPMATIHRICADRVLARGDKHQTLRADALAKSHEEVIWQFLQNAEELTDGEVDVAVEMDIEEPLEDALARVVDGCVRILGVPRPSQEQIGEALALARGYEPKMRRQDDKKKKVVEARYFGVLAEVDLEEVLAKRFAEDGAPEEGRAFYEKLVEQKRVAKRPHITIVHSKSLPEEKPLWDRCQCLHGLASPPLLSFRLDRLVWNDRVMAVTVSDLAVDADVEDPHSFGVDFVVNLPKNVKNRLHITVGTQSADIPPLEAKHLVELWKKEGDIDGVRSLELKDLWVKGRVKGLQN